MVEDTDKSDTDTDTDSGSGRAVVALDDGRDETETERADRQYGELLQELRVAQTGVQILFAFLLTLPFTQRWGVVDVEQRTVYLVALLASAVATACLIAPVSHHRILFRQRRKQHLVNAANRLAHAGLAFLAIGVIGAVYLIIDVVLGTRLAGILGGALALLFVLTWYVQPARLLVRRR